MTRAAKEISHRYLQIFIYCLLAAGCSKAPEAAKPTTAVPENTQSTAARAMPDFGGSEKVSTQSVGFGATLSSAVDDAIRNAIRQVNGQTVDASTESFQEAIAVSIGKDTAQLSSAGFAQMIATHSKGAVTDFELVSQEGQSDNTFKVTIKANVAKFKKPDSAKLTRVVIAPIRIKASSMIIGTRHIEPNTVAASLHTSVSDAIGQTQRFTVLDREFNSDIDSELDFIESGKVANDDYARLGQALATDLIWIGTLEQFNYVRHDQQLKTSERTLVSYSGGAVLSYRLINMTTRQVVLGDKVQIKLPDTEPTTLSPSIDENRVSADLLQQLSELAAQAVVRKFFPITVVALQGDDVVLSQGGKAVQSGKHYRVYQLGNELKDPQSGQSLGRMESECCVVEVNRITPETAYGRIVDKRLALPATLVPGSLEVREEVVAADESVAESNAQAKAAPRAASPTVDVQQKPATPVGGKTKSQNPDKDW